MNQRINKLAEQAASTIDTGKGNTYVSNAEFNKKFAELLLEETASLFPQQFTDEQYQRRIDKTIKKHFGMIE